MTDFQAALGISQLKDLKIVSERNKQYIIYDELLSDLPVNLLKIMKGKIISTFRHNSFEELFPNLIKKF